MVLANICIYSKPTNTATLGLKSHLPEQFPSGKSHWQKIRGKKRLKNRVSISQLLAISLVTMRTEHLVTQ